jgi:tellurite resistance protein TerC
LIAGPLEWAVFWTVLSVVFVADAVLARRGGRQPTLRAAALWSAAWIGLGLLFGVGLAVRFGIDVGFTYLTAYTLEKSLSVDNLFLFILVFSQTGIPKPLQHRALFWGIAGALIMRAVLIGVGVFLLQRFHWVIYPFAALLLWAAARMLWGEEAERRAVEASCALCTSWIARFIPITPVMVGSKFIVRSAGRWTATPLLVALVAIESVDVVLALDSIPAVFAVTRDPFLVYTSNVFALFGLRSLYFLLGGSISRLRFLRPALAVMLLFVAAKMLLGDALEISPAVSLSVIGCIFAVAIIASRLVPDRTMQRSAVVCSHTDQIKDVAPKSQGCEECLKLGDPWVHLRMCLTCGQVGCCDSSKNRHATRHFQSVGHPVMRSIEPGEDWRWCFIDQVEL